ncbi:apoptosis inducing factor mitochondria associated 4 isoform X2 [Denticeps clupeoides]|nr:apoptosis-inducing factor 3-like isoform X2 [Denticeps clupeoides]XP_028856440.1 apoptosis-inducing factor 3-like isoform X2 [Denticeps clupeoides]
MVPTPVQEEITEVACLESDLQNGQMKEVEVGQQKVLLVRGEAGFSAVGGLCSHYGAPLVKGALLGDRVRCPWHGACFNIKTGDIEDYPGLDCLPAYKVKVDDGKVYVTIKNKMTKRVKEMGGRVPDVCHTVMLIGGGPASLVCAETLRQNSYGGRIVIVTKEELLPFDKPKLSKALNVESGNILLRQSDFLQEHGIEVWTQREVISVDTGAKTVALGDGTVHGYNQLLIATGCRARAMQCPGAELENVKVLQSFRDAKEIHRLAVGKKVVVVGTSFIGMEVAAYLSDKAAIVSVIGTSDYAYQMSLGPAVGKMAMQILKDQNVKFYMKDGVSEIRGENGKVKEVLLKCGSVLDADVVVLGIGVTPNSDFLKGSQIATDSKSHVVVDKFMRTNVPDIFSAGDVASFPLTLRQNLQVNIAHWQMAHAHGRIAALNMLNKPTEMNSVPFFWTMLKGKSVRYAGYGEGYTQIVFKGNVEEQKFLAFYIKEGVVVAAASMNFDPAVARLAEMMATGRTITKAQAESDDLSWLQMP